MAIIMSDLGTFSVERGSGEGLWLSAEDAAETTGWSLRPEGLCRAEVCLPAPPGEEAGYVRDDAVNVAAFWHRMDAPAVHSDDGDIWVLGEPAGTRAEALERLEAPDFELPDLAGRRHRLSEHRGKKVILLSWSSW